MDKIKKEATKKIQTKKIQTRKNSKPKKVRTNYKKELEKTKKQLKLVQEQRNNIEKENQKNLFEFHALAKTFELKAKKQIEEKQKQIFQKFKKEQEHIKKYGSQKLLESLLEPLLNIELAINSGKKDNHVSSYVKGFEMLINQIYQELENFGVKTIIPKIGETFNPKEHHILSFSEKKGKKNTISKIFKKGFKLHDRLLKVAVVEVYK